MALNTAAAPRIVALAGGVGGARLAVGLAEALPPGALTVVVNTGDDFRHYGLAVSPDLDTVMYNLAGLAHPVNGWGLADDSQTMLHMLRRYGEAGWFGLGDRDLATNLLRTHWLASGQPLSAVTARLTAALGVTTHLLPMSDDPVATMVDTLDYGVLPFQEYFVRHRWQPVVRRLWYEGAPQARPAPGVPEALAAATGIVICPSNPVLSIEPILRVPGIRQALETRRVPCIAVSPLIGGQAVKGPTVKIMAELGLDASVSGISAYYDTLVDAFVVDVQDEACPVNQKKFVIDVLLNTPQRRVEVARAVLGWADDIRQAH